MNIKKYITKKYIFASLAVIALIALVFLAVSISINNSDGEENISGEAITTVGDRFSRIFGTEKVMVDKDNDKVYWQVEKDNLFNTNSGKPIYIGSLDKDGKKDLIVTGEWMPILVFENQDFHFNNVSETLGLEDTEGWWYSIAEGDFDRFESEFDKGVS